MGVSEPSRTQSGSAKMAYPAGLAPTGVTEGGGLWAAEGTTPTQRAPSSIRSSRKIVNINTRKE